MPKSYGMNCKKGFRKAIIFVFQIFSKKLILLNKVRGHDYYIDSKILWEELDSLRPLPTCNCEQKCSFDLVKVISDYRDSECVMCFLKGLGEIYNTIKT